MSETVKNIIYAVILIVLCILIKNKLDSNRADQTSMGQDIALVVDDGEDRSQKVSDNKVIASSDSEPSTSANNDKKSTINKSKPSDTDGKLEDKNDLHGDNEVKKPVPKAQKTVKKKKKPVQKPKKVVAKKMPQIKFDELFYDFGEIIEGDIVERKFKFTNTGNAPLQILTADADCGCARPTVPFLDIAPGESNEIGVTYNSVNKIGQQLPEIIIESNTSPKYNVLKMKVIVNPKKSEIEKDDQVATKDSIK